jgi:hypothetical protein
MKNGTLQVMRLAEQDYLYGTGELKLRVAHIDRANPIEYDGELWFRVEGVQLGWADVEVGSRRAIVRGRRLALEHALPL